jgi:hypothetical protein
MQHSIASRYMMSTGSPGENNAPKTSVADITLSQTTLHTLKIYFRSNNMHFAIMCATVSS